MGTARQHRPWSTRATARDAQPWPSKTQQTANDALADGNANDTDTQHAINQDTTLHYSTLNQRRNQRRRSLSRRGNERERKAKRQASGGEVSTRPIQADVGAAMHQPRGQGTGSGETVGTEKKKRKERAVERTRPLSASWRRVR